MIWETGLFLSIDLFYPFKIRFQTIGGRLCELLDAGGIGQQRVFSRSRDKAVLNQNGGELLNTGNGVL